MPFSRLPVAAVVRAVLPLFLLALALVPPRAARALETAFTVAMPKPTTHLLHVEMRVTGASGPTADLVMPVWTPGSYVLREYPKNVQGFGATDAGGRPLPWRKTSKNTWRVDTGGSASFVARYRVYANELKVQLLEVTDDHAFWNNAGVLMHVGNALKSPLTLTVRPPDGWKVATGLSPVAGRANTFRAGDVDELYDCPVEVGTFAEAPFTVKGVRHRLVVYNPPTNVPLDRVAGDVAKIVTAAGDLMGGDLPYPHYTFIVHVRRGAGGGGLEHRNSTVLGIEPDTFRSDYGGFLSLAAHEFFHLWNVKRIRPDALGPFDYSRENHTRLLWVAEGLTSYYEAVLLRRAGFLEGGDFLRTNASFVRSVEETPGRREQSLEESSFDAWIKYYRRDENSVNAQMSYYNKGAVVGMLLDLTIRARTGGKRSLDDVLRTLYADYAKAGRNYTPEDFQKVCETVAGGGSLDAFFDRAVRGRDDLDYDGPLKAVGLRLDRGQNGNQEAYLGANFAADPAGVRVSSILTDTPAFDQGLSTGDIVLSADDRRVTTPAELNARLADKSPGEKVRLTLFRLDRLRTLEMTLGGRVRPSYRLIPLATVTDEQRRLYQGWAGAAFPR